MTVWNELRGPGAPRPAADAFPLPQYRHARAALGESPETRAIATALETTAATNPRAGIPVPGTAVHILRANRYGDYPPVRLYYCIVGAAVHFLWIEHFDEMEA